jgi:hypothetical protein
VIGVARHEATRLRVGVVLRSGGDGSVSQENHLRVIRVAAVALCMLRGATALVAQQVQLPPGWRVAEAVSRVRARVTITGSADAVLIVVVPGADAMSRVSTLASAPSAAMVNVDVWPMRTTADGVVHGGATMRTGTGGIVTKFIAAATLANRTTAVIAYYTSEPKASTSVVDRLRVLENVMQQLQRGRSVPELDGSVALAPSADPAASAPTPARDNARTGSTGSTGSTGTTVATGGNTRLPSNVVNIAFYGFGADTRPVILFRNGIICDCMGYAFGSDNPAAFKSSHAGDFGRWRQRADGKFEYLFDQSSDTVWSALSGGFAKPLPDRWSTHGTYNRISGSGFDGNMTYATSSFTFSADGRFTTGSTISSTAQSGGATVFAGGESGKTSGRYEISGYMLQLTFDDGTTARKSITWQSDPDVIWINGAGFVR